MLHRPEDKRLVRLFDFENSAPIFANVHPQLRIYPAR
jgi:hypothetical protein